MKRKKKKSKARDYQKYLIESLKDPAEAVEYLNASLEEAKDMPELFLVALRNVAEAHGISRLAKKTKLNREYLYTMLSKQGNPRYQSLIRLLNAMGIRLAFELDGHKEAG
jgi:probable addiction module antidote protein